MTNTLPDYARCAAHEGDQLCARYVLLVYGDYRHWSNETRRARQDGAASLLTWWHEQNETTRPPLDNGMSLPEVCACWWFEIDLKNRTVLGYRKRLVRLGVPAVEALTRLMSVQPKLDPRSPTRMLGWNPDTARRWLKQIGNTKAVGCTD